MIDPMTTFLGTAATKAIEKSSAVLIEKILLKYAKDKYDVIKFSLKKGLPEYLAANYAKCETLKTLLNRNDPIALEDCFVAPNLKLKGETISSSDFMQEVNQSGVKAVITGLAGSGKSVFLKHSFRTVIVEGLSYYPIFFELRSLNSLPIKNNFLLAEIFSSIKTCCDSFTRPQFNHGLKSGAFYFLIDGFDELKQEIKEQVSAEISELARNYHNCAIVVTSRPSDEFLSWEGFSEAKLLPFDLEKVVEYISKLKFDEEKKDDFLADLKGGLFEKNKDFLSNPLLSAMMLLTYDTFGEIPEKRHIFYSKCFDVLAREHDASKGRYKRELSSNLSIDQLESVFMYFCAISYADRLFSFNDEQMKEYVDAAVCAFGVDAEATAIIKDFRESISIMELVGLTYEFAHRSFQEYFYAKFVIKDRKISLKKKIGRLTDSLYLDDTVEMIADMDRNYFEDEFLLPNLKTLDVKLSKIDPVANPSGVLSKFYNRIIVDIVTHNSNSDEDSKEYVFFTISNNSNFFILHQAVKKYSKEENSVSFGEATLGRIMISRMKKAVPGGRPLELKIHHSNNEKLKLVGADHTAVRIKTVISNLRHLLEDKQNKRKLGLGALIRSKYARG